MIECDYSIDLELRICREFRGMPENHLRFLWCDGLDPEQYLLDGPSPCITGRAWICNGQLQDQWEFRLLLNNPVDLPSKIDWPSLLPSDNVTRWLAVDPLGKRIQIEPGAALPDAFEPSAAPDFRDP
jgi:hypothetical protein